jgi:HEPN domain-containing protein
MRLGKALSYDNGFFVKKWMELAENDLLIASFISEGKPLITDIACFHIQQGIEKYLKAFLAYSQTEVPKTHDIDYLLELCMNIDVDFSVIDPKNVNDYAVRFRYPHDAEMPSSDELSEYFHIARQVKELVLGKVSG